MNDYKQSTKWYRTAIILSVLLVVCLLIGVLSHASDGFDQIIYQAMMSFEHPILTSVFKGITMFGNFQFVILVCIALMVVPSTRKTYGIRILASVLVCGGLNVAMKLMVHRARPNIHPLIEESGFSFPSAHAMVATAFYLTLAYTFFHYWTSKKSAYIASLLLLLLVFLISLSRIYLGVHYATDVLSGFFLSLAVLLFLQEAIDKYAKEHPNSWVL